MRILLIYPGHKHSTIDVACGYEKALKAIGHNVCAFNYHSSLVFYQDALEYWQDKNDEFWPDENAHLILASERAVIEAVDFVPDVVLIVNGMAFHRRAFDLLNRLCLPLVLLLTESPYLDEQQAVIMRKGHIAAALTNDRASVANLIEQSGVETVYLPHSYDPEVHRPRKAHPNYVNDVFFHGTLFPERKELFEALKGSPYKVRVSGPDPSTLTDRESVEAMSADILSNRELAFFYAGAKVAVNHHRRFVGVQDGKEIYTNGTPYSVGPRAFEIAACGAFQLCDDARQELKDVFGNSVATYADGGDLLSKIEHYLNRDAERQEMAQEALERVRGCTFENRAREILEPILREVA